MRNSTHIQTMSIQKQLIVVVEDTATLADDWSSILADYLEKIIRSFAGKGLVGLRTSDSDVQFAMVLYNAHGNDRHPCVVQRTNWTKDVDRFLRWLSSINFHGDCFDDAAVAVGLADALMWFKAKSSGIKSQEHAKVQKYCVLVAANKPYPLPVTVSQPMEQNDDIEMPPADAKTVAEIFSKIPVSLSVICQPEFPELHAIYNAGKRNPTSEDYVVDNGKHHNFIVLISETFMEARDALRHASVDKANYYVKAWEGNLWAYESGKHVLDARLEGYRKFRFATTFTSNSYFPSTITVKQVITQDQYNDILERHVIDDFVAFRTESTDPWFQLLDEKKMCAVIPYPLSKMTTMPTMATMPKTLLLIGSRDANFRLKGVVLFADVKDLFSTAETTTTSGAATTRKGKASKRSHGGFICVRL